MEGRYTRNLVQVRITYSDILRHSLSLMVVLWSWDLSKTSWRREIVKLPANTDVPRLGKKTVITKEETVVFDGSQPSLAGVTQVQLAKHVIGVFRFFNPFSRMI